MRNRIGLLCLAVLLVCVLPMTVFAQNFDAARKGSISVTLTEGSEKKPVAGAELSAYYVAEARIGTDQKLLYSYTGDFVNCDFSLDDPKLTEKLEAYIGEKKLEGNKQVTDAKGAAVYSNLPLGLYFVMQKETEAGQASCTPFLVTVPMQNDNGFVYDVDASPKTDVVRLVSITIRKVWNTDESSKISDSVSVRLMRNGAVVETAVLNKENNWTITYDNMPKSDAYSILEEHVPQGYTATYSQKDFEFTVTNTASLAQTGQLVWPIPVLALMGIVLLAAGGILLRKSGKDDA